MWIYKRLLYIKEAMEAERQKELDKLSMQSGKAEEAKYAQREEPKVGRNEDCTCGSGKKYKKCCGK